MWIGDKENKVDLAVIAGDLFDTGHADGIAMNRVAGGLNHMAQAGVPVLFVIGNHEWINAYTPSGGMKRTLQAEMFAHFANVYVCRDPEIVDIPNTDLRIAALPWPKPGDPHSAQADAAKGFADELLNHSGPRLCVAHAAVEGATVITKTGSERDLWAFTSEPVTPIADIDIPEAFAHTTIGHIHRRQSLSPTCSYVGSNEAFTFADEGQAKGFSVLDWHDDNRWEENQIVVGEHIFRTVSVGEDISDLPESANVRLFIPTGADSASIAETHQDLADAGVRLRGEKHEADDPKSEGFDLDEFCDGAQLAHAGMSREELMYIYFDREGTPDKDREAVLELADTVFAGAA